MKINVPFRRKDMEIEVNPCVVERTIELPSELFKHFSENLLNDYDFILENIDCMYQDKNGVSHCLLVLGEGRNDGILVESEGSVYARYSAFVPNARSLVNYELYPSLKSFTDEMCRTVDKFTKKAVNGQIDCKYRIDFDEVRNFCRHDDFNEQLFINMLSDREEIQNIEFLDDGCAVTISEPYLRAEDEQNLRLLSSDEIEVMCAKHVLWLHDAGGEQADFSDCLIKDMNLSGKNLINAVFDGAKLSNVNLRNAELCFSVFNDTEIYNCTLSDVVAEETEFKNAECIGSDFDRGIFKHSDFTGAKFRDCSMNKSSLQHSCLDGTDFGDMPLDLTNANGCRYDKEVWLSEGESSVVTIDGGNI